MIWLKLFFVAGIVLFFLVVWYVYGEPGAVDRAILPEELRRIDREALGCEDDYE